MNLTCCLLRITSRIFGDTVVGASEGVPLIHTFQFYSFCKHFPPPRPFIDVERVRRFVHTTFFYIILIIVESPERAVHEYHCIIPGSGERYGAVKILDPLGALASRR